MKKGRQRLLRHGRSSWLLRMKKGRQRLLRHGRSSWLLRMKKGRQRRGVQTGRGTTTKHFTVKIFRQSAIKLPVSSFMTHYAAVLSRVLSTFSMRVVMALSCICISYNSREVVAGSIGKIVTDTPADADPHVTQFVQDYAHVVSCDGVKKRPCPLQIWLGAHVNTVSRAKCCPMHRRSSWTVYGMHQAHFQWLHSQCNMDENPGCPRRAYLQGCPFGSQRCFAGCCFGLEPTTSHNKTPELPPQ